MNLGLCAAMGAAVGAAVGAAAGADAELGDSAGAGAGAVLMKARSSVAGERTELLLRALRKLAAGGAGAECWRVFVVVRLCGGGQVGRREPIL
jgi:hypothetical protein